MSSVDNCVPDLDLPTSLPPVALEKIPLVAMESAKNQVSGSVEHISTYSVLDVKEGIFVYSVRHILQLIERNRVLFLSVCIAILTSVVIYLICKNPIYTSVVTLEVTSYAPTLATDDGVEDAFASQTRGQDYINTLKSQMLSPSLAKSTLLVPAVKNQIALENVRLSGQMWFRLTAWLRSWLSDKDHAQAMYSQNASKLNDVSEIESSDVNFLLDSMIVKNIFKTSLISLEVKTTSPVLSSAIANAHAENFVDWVSERRRRSTINKLEFLRKQAQELEVKVKEAENKLANYAEKHAVVNVGKQDNVILKQFEELSQVLTSATAKRLQSNSILQGAKRDSTGRLGGIDDSSLAEIKASLKESEAEYSSLSVKNSKDYPKMRELSAKIRSLKDQIVAALSAQYDLDLETERNIKDQLKKVRNDVFSMSKDQVQYNAIQDEYTSIKDLRHAILFQIEQARLGAADEESNVTISEPGMIAPRPTYPRKGLSILVSLLLAPVLGILIALLKDKLDRTFRSSEEVEGFLSTSALGVIPDFGNIIAKSFNPETQLSDCISSRIVTNSQHEQQLAMYKEVEDVDPILLESRYAAEEAFKLLRANILLPGNGTHPKVIAITSAVKGEGKTTVSANLTVALSQVSGKCVVVESDLRQPSLCSLLKVDRGKHGLADYLLGAAQLDDILIQTENDKLLVISSGTMVKNTSDLVTSDKMKALIEELSKRFAFVILDTPPLLAVSDAVTLSKLADAVLMVVRAKHTNREMVKAARMRLQRVGCKLLGVIINRTAKTSSDSYYSDYVYMNYGA